MNLKFIQINKTASTSVSFAFSIKPKQHHTAEEMSIEEGWGDAYKFSFIRNPYERVVSMYAYRRQNNQQKLLERNLTFHEWVRLTFVEQDLSLINNVKYWQPQWDWLNINGQLAVDFIGRFETLQQDFYRLCKETGRKAALKHCNKSNHNLYKGYYTYDIAQIVYEAHKDDFGILGYDKNSWL